MSEREIILDRLRRKEQEIHALEEKIRAARIYIVVLRDILKAVDAGGSDESEAASPKPGSTVAQARELILQAGTPIHLNELMEGLGRESTREARASVTSQLAAYVRRGEIFTRPAPGTFGLLELDHNMKEEKAGGPPAGFGLDQDDARDIDEDIPF